jgi:4-amino-4-deoxy-L-arabinose transferase-like glycosyltransferase
MPYADAWDVKGPLVHVLFAIAGGLFGRNEWGLRVFDLGFLALGAVAVARIARAYGGPGAARVAAALVVLWYAALGHHDTAQPDAWAGALLAAGVALLVGRGELTSRAPTLGARGTPGRAASVAAPAIAAFLVGLCTLVKPTYAAMLVLPVLHVVTTRRRHGPLTTILSLVALGAGFAMPVLACLAWITAHGALPALRDVEFGWIPAVYTDVANVWPSRLREAMLYLVTGTYAVPVALALGALAVVWRRRRGDATLLAVWTAGIVTSIMIQGKFWTYHWLPLLPPLAALAGIGVAALWQERVRAARAGYRTSLAERVVLSTLVVVAVLPPLVPAVMHVVRASAVAVGLTKASAYEQTEFGPYGRHGVFQEASRYVRAHTRADESLLVWGRVAGVNYLSGRPSASRFGFAIPLADPPDNVFRRRYRAELLADVVAAPPRYVLALEEGECGSLPTYETRKARGAADALMYCLGEMPELHDFVARRYAVERRFGPLELWGRLPNAEGGP